MSKRTGLSCNTLRKWLRGLLVEQVRVNPKFDLGFVKATQAEIIASLLIVMGCIGLALLTRRSATKPQTQGEIGLAA